MVCSTRYIYPQMRLALWNCERACADRPTRLGRVQQQIAGLDADILVCTEASLAIGHSALAHRHSSKPLPLFDEHILWMGNPNSYKPGEVRSLICSRYPIIRYHAVADSQTNCCADFATPAGPVRVLATILGIVNKKVIWQHNLDALADDLARLAAPHLILAGDMNVSLPTGPGAERRAQLQALLAHHRLTPATAGLAGALGAMLIDHIALGTGFAGTPKVEITSVPRLTSDHPVVKVAGIELAGAQG